MQWQTIPANKTMVEYIIFTAFVNQSRLIRQLGMSSVTERNHTHGEQTIIII